MKDMFNLNESEKNRIKGLYGLNIVNEQKEATLQTKIDMVDCVENYDIPEIVINLAGSMSNSMMGAVPEGKNPYMVWMAAFISNVIKDKRTDYKLLEDIESGSGCMYEILKSHDMLDVV
jgi:hypothetical protein